jgi:transcriptional regulator with XRE-family HTH domain
VILHYKILRDFWHLAGMIRKNDHRILVSFGNNLKRQRKAKGLSLRQFAALADIDHAMIDRYERGITNPSLTTIAKLAEALEIEPFELLQDKKKG